MISSSTYQLTLNSAIRWSCPWVISWIYRKASYLPDFYLLCNALLCNAYAKSNLITSVFWVCITMVTHTHIQRVCITMVGATWQGSDSSSRQITAVKLPPSAVSTTAGIFLARGAVGGSSMRILPLAGPKCKLPEALFSISVVQETSLLGANRGILHGYSPVFRA